MPTYLLGAENSHNILRRQPTYPYCPSNRKRHSGETEKSIGSRLEALGQYEYAYICTYKCKDNVTRERGYDLVYPAAYNQFKTVESRLGHYFDFTIWE
jgi:hypothetical protein